jgi:capsular exopolysaccharide synthesis family protein
MSKIYEALRRAEMERGHTVGNRNGHKRRDFPILSAEDTDDSDVLTATPIAEPFTTTSHDIETFAEIRAERWQPAVDRLPALQARGGGVEQFRSLRSKLYEYRVMDKVKSVLVTSGVPQEGKSYIAANLAISLARHRENHVLLIDGDMRRPSQHKLLGAPHTPGLTEYLSGSAPLEAVLQKCEIVESSSPIAGLGSLAFIGAGADSDKAADLSLNARFEHLLQAVDHLFDWIIVDSSPVNLVSDAVNLSRVCNGVLLIARSGVTQLQTGQDAMLALSHTKVLGCVLNAAKDLPARKQYYGYNGYDPKETQELAS